MTPIDKLEAHLKDAVEDLLEGDECIAVLTEVSDCCRRVRFGPDGDRAMSQLFDIAAHNLDEHVLPRLLVDDHDELARQAAIDLLSVRAHLLELEKAGAL